MGRRSFKDDGGASKDSSRMYRRKRQRFINVVSIPLGVLFIIWLLIQVQHHVDRKMDEKRNRNRAMRKRLHDVFTGKHINEGNDQSSSEQRDNVTKSKYRWIDNRVLPPLDNNQLWWKKFMRILEEAETGRRDRSAFKLSYGKKEMFWEAISDEVGDKGPTVDYTNMDYVYPEPILIPPRGGSYPPLEPMKDLFKRWPQDDIDSPPSPFVEMLQHFDFNDPEQMEAAVRYRDLEFPFKVYNIPEIDAAGEKWTDEYLTYHFDRVNGSKRKYFLSNEAKQKYGDIPASSGKAQYSQDSFFAFFNAQHWDVDALGEPPTLDTDMSFDKWAKHARYADAVGLAPDEVHYYWQSGVSRSEIKGHKSGWTMISNDLPSFSDLDGNFFLFEPENQKGIQCRFGERGVTAATHYDGGRNMVGMITGAKRYMLSPPKECSKLGIVASRKHPTYRHSLLNFGHINLLESDDEDAASMPKSEREWLEVSKSGLTIETILKAGEVLYIPSHWFHYIISLQKSAQCNVRSGPHEDGSPEWGGEEHVNRCVRGDDD